MANIIINKTAFLDAPITVDSLHGMTFTNESGAHQFVISAMQGGNPLALTGSVSARFMRANNTTILLTGSVTNGKAVITLHQDCYNVPGRFQLAIFNTVSGTTTCIYAAIGTVQRTVAGDLIDSGEAVPDISDLLAQIDACEQATAAANAAATKAVRYDSAQTLTDAQKTQARTNVDGASVDDVNDLKSAIDEIIEVSTNRLNPALFQEGKYIVNGGGLNDSETLTASGFFKVDGNKTYYMYRSNTYQVRVAYYTTNNVAGYISMDSAISASTPGFTTPATARYARLSTNKNMIMDMGVYETDIKYYIPYQFTLSSDISIENQIDNTLTDSKKVAPASVVGEIKKVVIFPESCIKFGDIEMIVDERLNLTDGSIVTGSSGQTRTDYIPVSVNDYVQTCAIRYICLYNDQFEYLGYINLWSSSDTVAPPSTWSGNYRSNITKITTINGYSPAYIRCWGVYNQYPPAVTFLSGEPYRVVNLGDSIFGNNEKPWDLGTYIQNITGLKDANCGYGGTTARVIPSGNMAPLGLPSIVDCIVAEDFSSLQTPSYWAGKSEYMYTVPTLLFPLIDFEKIKVITIAYGTNDYNSNTPLDNENNKFDTSTYCGGLRYAVKNLLQKYPTLTIVMLSPIYRYWSNSSDYSTVDEDSNTRENTLHLKLTDYVTAMKGVAEEYGLPFFDNYHTSGLNKFTAPTWLRDGTHLTRTIGADMMGYRIAGEIDTVY